MTSTAPGLSLIIVAFAMAALMGIGAIVVDLGLSWMLHRQEQNAADPASIAAAAYIEEGDTLATRTKMHTAACFYAQENGFFETDDVTCMAARTAGDLQVHWPPISGDFIGNNGMVQVIIRAEHPSFFGGIFGRELASVATGAVAASEQRARTPTASSRWIPTSAPPAECTATGRSRSTPSSTPKRGTLSAAATYT